MRGRHWPIWLDSGSGNSGDARYDILACDPEATLVTRGTLTEISGNTTRYTLSSRNPFQLLREQLAQHKPAMLAEPGKTLPFVGGALGYFGYDLHRRLENLPNLAKDDLQLPEMMVGIYTLCVVVDRKENAVWLVSTGKDHQTKAAFWRTRLMQATTAQTPPHRLVPAPVSRQTPKPAYLAAFEKIQHYILEGDCYQVNLTQRFNCTPQNSGWEIYQQLRARNPAPYSAYMKLGEVEILSSSPERFLSLRDATVETKPIKGTRPRGNDEESDAVQIAALQNSEKDRAENLMIVDLLRNDLGKVCKPGSIHCPELFAIESFATVHHLVSTVRGELAEGEDAISLLQACFPGGSITGAPKIRAMEIIEELEPVRRGVYCGAIGYMSFDGDMDTNIVIRTLVLKDGKATFSTGGGIVVDSVAEEEYRESLLKAKALAKLFEATDT